MILCKLWTEVNSLRILTTTRPVESLSTTTTSTTKSVSGQSRIEYCWKNHFFVRKTHLWHTSFFLSYNAFLLESAYLAGFNLQKGLVYGHHQHQSCAWLSEDKILNVHFGRNLLYKQKNLDVRRIRSHCEGRPGTWVGEFPIGFIRRDIMACLALLRSNLFYTLLLRCARRVSYSKGAIKLLFKWCHEIQSSFQFLTFERNSTIR